MAIVTTYICDVSGKQGNQEEFVRVTIAAEGYHKVNGHVVADYSTRKVQEKLVHRSVADKLSLLAPNKAEEQQPEPTLESKLLVLLKDYVTNIAYEAGSEAAVDAVRNY